MGVACVKTKYPRGRERRLRETQLRSALTTTCVTRFLSLLVGHGLHVKEIQEWVGKAFADRSLHRCAISCRNLRSAASMA
jgi:hypothetical protein